MYSFYLRFPSSCFVLFVPVMQVDISKYENNNKSKETMLYLHEFQTFHTLLKIVLIKERVVETIKHYTRVQNI